MAAITAQYVCSPLLFLFHDISVWEDEMLNAMCLHDKTEIAQFLKNDVDLHIYSIGDLDDFFWPYTTWYGSKSDGFLDAVVLLYSGTEPPTLLALSNEHAPMERLLSATQHLLPFRFYAHLSPGLETTLSNNYAFESPCEHWKMALPDDNTALSDAYSEVVHFGTDDLSAIRTIYHESYPGNWFDARMLETGKYVGVVENGQIISIAGIHVYSRVYGVAALGNITTLPDYRNQGYGSRVTSALCSHLLGENVRIGLNVQADNEAAIACYRRIGFKRVATYTEMTATRKLDHEIR